MPAGLLEGKTAIITGANRGIGAAMVLAFASQGANIWACAREDTAGFKGMCEEIGKTHGVEVRRVFFDLTDVDSMKDAYKEIKSHKCAIDILVNNAGIVPESRLFPMMSIDELHRIFNVNFFSLIQFTQMVTKGMIRQKSGSIINLSSAAAMDGFPAQLEYVSSKAAVSSATKKLAQELGIFGIRVNALAPSSVETDMVDNLSDELRSELVARTALKRFASPREIADVAVFLGADMSSYITGQTIRVDGGYH